MPNNVKNIVKFDCSKKKFEEIAEFLRRDGSYLGTVDFNKLMPMPKDLDIISGSTGYKGYKMYIEYLKEIKGIKNEDKINDIYLAYIRRSEDAEKEMELGKQYYNNIEKYGAPTWYEWCCDNWGTKWNAYDCEEAEDNTLRFETAWSAVPAIIKEIARKYPNVNISYKWADEDIGRNVGTVYFKKGKIDDIIVPEIGSKEAYEMSADIWDFDLKDVGFELSEDEKTYILNIWNTPDECDEED